MRPSFRQRVLLLVAGLVVVAQLLSFAAVLTTIERDVQSGTRADLERGAERLADLLERRSTTLLASAEVLAADFGFRSAIASRDPLTVRSALENNVGRIGADLAALVGLDGELPGGMVTAAGPVATSAADAAVHAALARGIADGEGGGTRATVVLAGHARQVVLVPVKAPLTLGWLLLGFSLDDALARELVEQVDMEVSFAARDGDGRRVIDGSTLGRTARADLPGAMETLRAADAGTVATLADETFLTREVVVGGEGGAVTAILQTSLDEALAGYRELRGRLLLLGALSLAFALVLAVRFARGVTRPIEQLSAAARRVAAGDYDTSLGIERDDELGELATTFARMQAGIADREATIVHRALHDELTQLPNRRLARERLEQALAEGRRDGRPLVVALVGIERYRQVVATLGHPVGEHLLREVTARLTARVREGDTVARVAPDEFLLILRDVDREEAERGLDGLLARLAVPVTLESAELAPTPVAGLVLCPDQAAGAASAMHRASIALADAREGELPRLFYAEGGDQRHLRRLALVADLRRAVEHDELTLHYQPKVTLADGVVRSCEALVRWIHPEHGFMPPDEFISLAESSGNISLLTDWVIERAIRQQAAWRGDGIDVAVAVNLSALDLQDDSLPARVAAMLAAHGVAPSRLILEVTESAMMRDTDQALALLATLRASGVTLSIDDFGTGYSSLAKLRDLPIDELKIDRAFIVGIEPDSLDALIVRTIIELGHGLGLKITTEGVETAAERDVLAGLGCDVVQGYLYSRPLEAEPFAAWYAAHPPHAASVDSPVPRAA